MCAYFAIQNKSSHCLNAKSAAAAAPLSCRVAHGACAIHLHGVQPVRMNLRPWHALARQVYLGHSSAGTESAGPPTAKTIALTAPLPQIQTNSSWAAQCSSCVGTTGVAAAPSPSASAVTAHNGLCAKCGFSTVRIPRARASLLRGIVRQQTQSLQQADPKFFSRDGIIVSIFSLNCFQQQRPQRCKAFDVLLSICRMWPRTHTCSPCGRSQRPRRHRCASCGGASLLRPRPQWPPCLWPPGPRGAVLG